MRSHDRRMHEQRFSVGRVDGGRPFKKFIGNGKSWCEHYRLRQVEGRIKVVSKVRRERV